MSEWLVWLALAGILLMLEIFTGTFYLLMVAVGLAAGGLAALLGTGVPFQFMLAAITGGAATLLLHRGRRRLHESNPAADPNVNLDVGQTVSVPAWNRDDGGRSTARAMYRGSKWDVELAGDAQPEPGDFVIREIRGSRLFVSKLPARGGIGEGQKEG